jgi:hypothetical protein
VIAVVNNAEAGSERIHSSTLFDGVGRKVPEKTFVSSARAGGNRRRGDRRTLTAVDNAVMVLDATPRCRAGIEEQTHTLRLGLAHHDRLSDETSPSREYD